MCVHTKINAVAPGMFLTVTDAETSMCKVALLVEVLIKHCCIGSIMYLASYFSKILFVAKQEVQMLLLVSFVSDGVISDVTRGTIFTCVMQMRGGAEKSNMRDGGQT